ncbi:MAG: hypothetical protein GY745_01420 [Actinomycetia bacterium]|nr:hypothetical protein [Actinomycetes bacterium]
MRVAERLFADLESQDIPCSDMLSLQVSREPSQWVVSDADGFAQPGDNPHAVAGHLVSAINRLAVTCSPLMALHAGGVTHRTTAVVLAAPSGFGKSTLTGALVLAGCGYLSDEAIGIDSNSLAARPYHKPLTLKSGSFAVLPDLQGAALEVDDGVRAEWHVPVGPTCGRLALAAQTPIGHIVLPHFQLSAKATTLELLRPAEAVMELAGCAFAGQHSARERLTILARLANTIPVHRLVSNDLHETVVAVSELAGWADLDSRTPLPW